MKEERLPDFEMITTEDCYIELDHDQRKDLRAFLARVAMDYLNAVYSLTDVIVANGEEPKSRRKRFEAPPEWMEGA